VVHLKRGSSLERRFPGDGDDAAFAERIALAAMAIRVSADSAVQSFLPIAETRPNVTGMG
jgi:hypothetical protein